MLDHLDPIELFGNAIALVPLEPSHREGLLEAASDGKLWELWYTSVPSAESIDHYIEVALAEKSQGNSDAFTIFQKEMDPIVGSTRFLNINHQHRRLEIGHTWYGKSVQRTAVNTECKYLLLRYAFESLNCIAVEFRTHWHNHRSRNAILRLGAKQDGILRNHRIGAQGVLRDTVVYSIIESEWPTVKRSLDFKMKQYNIL